HQKGIIHRDIKPSNVMVTLHDGQPVVKVIDFGIAKAVNQQLTEKTVFTRYSQMIGTPEYMSPEQAEMSGLDIDTRTDVFSLGVLLYELLTGTTPFDSEYLLSKGYGEMQRIIREEEPIRPSTRISTLGETLTDVAKRRRTSPELLCKLIRSDLDWIVMKTMEKNRNRRYESVSEFTADIKRHLNNEPVLAGRPSTVYRVQKFVKRNKLLVTSATVIAVILVFATTVSLWQMVRANHAAKQERIVSEQLQIEKENALVAGQSARTAERTAKQQRDRAEASKKDARLNLYAADMKAVQLNIDNGNLGAAQKLLQAYDSNAEGDDVRGWEWRYLWKKAQGDHQERFSGHEHWIISVAFSPDGQLLASGSDDKSVIVWNKDGEILSRHLTDSTTHSVSFSKDGMYLAAGTYGGEVLVWDTKDFKLFKHFTEQNNGSASAEFSPSEPTLAIVYGNGRIKLWDYTTNNEGALLGQSIETYQENEERQEGEIGGCTLAFSSDGKYLVTFASGIGQYDVWDIGSSQKIASLEDFQGIPFGPWQHVSFVPGRSTLFLGDGLNGSLLWDFDSDNINIPISKTVADDISQAVFNSDGTLMATAGYDHVVHLWDVSGTSIRKKARLLGHTNEAWAIAISPDNMKLATGGMDDDILIWNTEHQQSTETIPKAMIACIPRFSHDGQLIALAGGKPPEALVLSSDLKTYFYDLEASCFLETVADGYPLTFADSETEIIMLRTKEDSVKHVKWNWAKSRASWETDLGAMPGLPSTYPAVCKSRNLLATGLSDGSVIVANSQDGTKIKEWKAHQGPVGIVAFSPDGNFILTAMRIITSVESSIIMWSCSDMENIEPRYEIRGHRSFLLSAAFDPYGKILATGGVDSKILLWDAATGDFRQELVGQKELVNGLTFTPDGKTLVSATTDGTVRFWHVATGRELIKLQIEYPLSVAFSPDSTTLAATSGSEIMAPEELHIWRVPSFEEIESSKEVSLQE
ncbi:protein kinase, partial [Planctomycetota bacterium]